MAIRKMYLAAGHHRGESPLNVEHIGNVNESIDIIYVSQETLENFDIDFRDDKRRITFFDKGFYKRGADYPGYSWISFVVIHKDYDDYDITKTYIDSSFLRLLLGDHYVKYWQRYKAD